MCGRAELLRQITLLHDFPLSWLPWQRMSHAKCPEISLGFIPGPFIIFSPLLSFSTQFWPAINTSNLIINNNIHIFALIRTRFFPQWHCSLICMLETEQTHLTKAALQRPVLLYYISVAPNVPHKRNPPPPSSCLKTGEIA